MGTSTDVNFYITDGKGLTSTLTIPIPSGTAAANLIPFAQTMWDLIDPLINGGNVEARISISVPGITSSNPVAGGDVQEIGRFIFRAASTAIKRLGIPTFLETKILPSSKEVDTSDADVAAFITAMTDGVSVVGHGGSGTVSPCNLYESDLDTLVAAFEDWGKVR